MKQWFLIGALGGFLALVLSVYVLVSQSPDDSVFILSTEPHHTYQSELSRAENLSSSSLDAGEDSTAELDDARAESNSVLGFREQIEATYGKEETDFRMMLVQNAASDWTEIRELIAHRSKLTGQDYRDLLMTLGLMRGEWTTLDLMEFVHGGVPLPPDTLLILAANGQVREIVELDRLGVLPVSDANVPGLASSVELLVRQFTFASYSGSPDAAIEDLDALLSLGIPAETGDGTDLLTFVLSQPHWHDQDIALSIVDHLVSTGAAYVQPHHRELDLEWIADRNARAQVARLIQSK